MIVACDIDGVLADIRGFHHILPDWDEYFKHTLEFPVIDEVATLVSSLSSVGHSVVVITGRPMSNRQDTVLWLARYIPGLDTADIRMRQNGDRRPSVEVKLEMIKDIGPALVIEDEPKVVMAARDEGFTVLQVHGYRFSDSDGVPYTESIGISEP